MFVQFNASSLAAVKNNAATHFGGGLGASVVRMGAHTKRGEFAKEHPLEYANGLLQKWTVRVGDTLKAGKSPSSEALGHLVQACGNRLLLDA